MPVEQCDIKAGGSRCNGGHMKHLFLAILLVSTSVFADWIAEPANSQQYGIPAYIPARVPADVGPDDQLGVRQRCNSSVRLQLVGPNPCGDILAASEPNGGQPPISTLMRTPVPDLIFQTSFDIPEWTQGGGRDPAPSDDAIKRYGDWTAGGQGDQIIAAANRPGSLGNGFRHYRNAGRNSNGGGLKILLPFPVTAMWVRYYMRYSAGFSWVGGRPQYTKELYWNVGGLNILIFGHQGGGWGLNSRGVLNVRSSSTWADTPAGQWHMFEYHVQQAEGIVEVWVNGVQVLSRRGLNLGNVPWSHFGLGSNQHNVLTGGYTDYDDIAVSTVGRIGALQ
jgi:hypothetical protein